MFAVSHAVTCNQCFNTAKDNITTYNYTNTLFQRPKGANQASRHRFLISDTKRDIQNQKQIESPAEKKKLKIKT